MTLQKTRQVVDKVVEWVLVILMAANVFNVLWQVCSRFVLRRSSPFTEELARYLLIWLGLIGAGYVTGKKMHLAIDVALKKLKGRAKIFADLLIQVLICLFSLLALVIGGIRLVIITLALNQTSAALQVKLGFVYFVLPLSGILIMFYALEAALGSLHGLSAASALPREKPEKVPR